MERQHILTLLAVSFISFSCNKEMYYLESALQFAGDNRPELEKVLKHYSSPADNLKYRAAVFLIKNMPAYYGHEGAAVDTIRKALTAVYDVYGYFYDEKLIRAAKEFSYDDLTRVFDAKVITADYLIENIEMAFEQWEKRPWNKNLSFDDFCEYLLPYRTRDEPLENWRRAYHEKYGKALDSLYTGTDPVVAANVLNRYIKETERVVFNGLEFKTLSPGALYFLRYKVGSCVDMKDVSIYMLRACGIPASCHFYIYSPDLRGNHTWAAIRDTTGQDIPFSAPGMEVGRDIDIGLRKGKVYMRTFGMHPGNSPAPVNEKEVLPIFRDPHVRDVSVYYTGENETSTRLTGKRHRYIYLGVQTGARTTPIAVTRTEGKNVVFPHVEEGLIYQLFYLEKGRLEPAAYPVMPTGGKVHVFVPDTTRKEKLTLYRKYGLNNSIYHSMNLVVGGTLDGAREPGFQSPVFRYTILDSLRDMILQVVYPPADEPIRYIRFTAPENCQVNVAEISIYTQDDTLSALQDIKLTVPERAYMGIYSKSLIDGDLLTYYMSIDLGASITLDTGYPRLLHRVELTPHTDDNFVRPGDVYELYYHAGEAGWISLGKQKADKQFLEYENVPADALLWLQNHSRGEEEQVFYMENGRQIFSGKTSH